MKILKQEQFNIGFERRKIPRYVYHFTNEKAYDSILKDGFIKTSDYDLYTDKAGIFMVDLWNFFKFWGKNKAWNEDDSETLRKSLLRIAAKWINTIDKKSGNLVILRIPTSRLQPEEFAVRSQNTFFKYHLGKPKVAFHSIPPKEQDNIAGRTIANSGFGKKLRKHEASEYIYFDNIPINDVQLVGEIVNISDIKKSTEGFRSNPVKSILQRALFNTPEANWLKNLNE